MQVENLVTQLKVEAGPDAEKSSSKSQPIVRKLINFLKKKIFYIISLYQQCLCLYLFLLKKKGEATVPVADKSSSESQPIVRK